MIIKTDRELKTYQTACNLSMQILKRLTFSVKPGMLPIEVDNLAKKLCRENQVKPAFLGVGQPQYPNASCVCVNDAAVHCIPNQTEKFKIGDLVKIDFGIIYQGFYTDFCVTVAVGKFIDKISKKLVETAKQAVKASIKAAIPGNFTGDIGHIMHSIALSNGFDVLKRYTGHGIGHTLHDQPSIPAHGQPKTGVPFIKGQVVCLEAQIVEKSDEVAVGTDGWTVSTVDHGRVAMFEYMVVVDNPPLVLSPTFNWPLIV